MDKPIVMIGGGGHAKVLVEALRLDKRKILGFVDPVAPGNGFCDLAYLGDDEAVRGWSPSDVELVNGLGSISKESGRRRIYAAFKNEGYVFASVIHPSAIVSPSARLLEGAQIMAGCVIQAGAVVGENTIVNTKASIDHDCVIGSNVHLAPGVTVCGGVSIEEDVFVGAGAVVIQGKRIGKNSQIGAGAVVLEDVNADATAIGIPAREV